MNLMTRRRDELARGPTPPITRRNEDSSSLVILLRTLQTVATFVGQTGAAAARASAPPRTGRSAQGPSKVVLRPRLLSPVHFYLLCDRLIRNHVFCIRALCCSLRDEGCARR